MARDRADGIDAGRRRRPDRRDDRQRPNAASCVLVQGGGERIRSHAEFRVGLDAAQRVVAEAEQDDGLVDRRVRVLGAVDPELRQIEASRQAARPHVGGRQLTRRGEGVEGRDGGGVVDDAGEFVGQAKQLPQPRERHFLELGGRRGGAPQHGLHVERGRQELGEHAGPAAGDGEVREEAGMVPVRDAGEDDLARSPRRCLRMIPPARAAMAGGRCGCRRAAPARAPENVRAPRSSPRSSRRSDGPRGGSPPDPCRRGRQGA